MSPRARAAAGARRRTPRRQSPTADKIQPELAKRLQDVAPAESGTKIPVIISLKKGVEVSTLDEKGLKPYRNMPGYFGGLTAEEVEDVAQMDEVRTIEYDGKVWALDKESSD
jgi:hypothetical protein